MSTLGTNFRTRISNLRSHNFVKNVAVLQVGNFGSTLVSGLSGIILARILQPQLFGVYSLAFGLASLLVLFVSLGLQDSVTTLVGKTYGLKDRLGTHEALMFLARMTIIIGALSFLAAWLAPKLSIFFYHDIRIGLFAGILIIASFISNTWLTFSVIAFQVSGKIKQMSLLVFADQATRSSGAILLALAGFGIAGAIYGNLLGSLIICVVSIILWERLRKSDTLFPSVKELLFFWKASYRKYLRFSAWVALDKNIATLYGILPILMVGLYVSTAEVTYFKISFAYINLSMSFMGPISTLLAVQFPRMHAVRSGDLRKTFLRVSLYSLLMSAVLTTGAILVSPILLKILYGESFLPGLKYVSGLFVYGAFLGIGVGLGPMWRAINKVRVSIIINTIVLAIGIPVGFYLLHNYSIWGAVIMVTLWFTVSHLISFFYLLSHLE